MEMLIYKYENKINHKKYIGLTTNFKKRQFDHLRSSINGYDNYTLHKAIRKYGIENFDIDILCYCESMEELKEKEIYYIKHYKSYFKDGGYNLTLGGDGINGYKHSEERSKKLSERMMGNQYTKGHKLSDEHRAKLSEARRDRKTKVCGWHHTEEQKKAISIRMKGRVLSQEHLEKKRLKSYESRDKTLYKFINTLTNKEVILSPYDFSKQYNIDRSSVTKLKLKKIKMYKGWILEEAA